MVLIVEGNLQVSRTGSADPGARYIKIVKMELVRIRPSVVFSIIGQEESDFRWLACIEHQATDHFGEIAFEKAFSRREAERLVAMGA